MSRDTKDMIVFCSIGGVLGLVFSLLGIRYMDKDAWKLTGIISQLILTFITLYLIMRRVKSKTK